MKFFSKPSDKMTKVTLGFLLFFILITALLGIVFWTRIENVFFGGCGDSLYSDSTGHCFFANHILLHVEKDTSREDVGKIVDSVGGVIVFEIHPSYPVSIPARTKKEQEIIIEKLYSQSPAVKNVIPVSRAFYSPSLD